MGFLFFLSLMASKVKVVCLAGGELGVEASQKEARGVRFGSIPDGFSESVPESNGSELGFCIPGVRGVRTSHAKSESCVFFILSMKHFGPHAVICK